MSTLAKRQEIADALNTVDGVKAYIYRPNAPKASSTSVDAWCRLGPSSRLSADQGLEFEDTWYVLVFLPQTEAGADKWRDEHQSELVTALEDNYVGFVDEITPVNLSPTEGQPTFGLQLTLRSE